MRVGGDKIAWLIENTRKVGAKKTQHCGLYGKCCAFNPIAMRLSWGNSNPEPTEETNLEIRMVSATVMITPTNFPLFTCYSYKRLSRIIAYCIHCARNTKERSRTQRTAAHHHAPLIITTERMKTANTVLHHTAQLDAFSMDPGQPEKGNVVTKQTPWRTLSSLLEPLGIIWAGEILRHTQQPYHAKHPVLLKCSRLRTWSTSAVSRSFISKKEDHCSRWYGMNIGR